MITCLFLDTDDKRYFSEADRCAIQNVCEAVEPEVRALLPMLPGHIEIAAQTGKHVLPQTGERGLAVTAHRVEWVVDPGRLGGVEATAKSQLRCTLFHEFHHLSRGWVKAGGKRWDRFIDGAICEGLATAFERDFGGRKPPWGAYSAEVAAWVEELLALPLNAPYHHWMFQHPDGRKWIGYRAGTFIADQVFKATGRTSADLATTPTDDILAMAGFGR